MDIPVTADASPHCGKMQGFVLMMRLSRADGLSPGATSLLCARCPVCDSAHYFCELQIQSRSR